MRISENHRRLMQKVVSAAELRSCVRSARQKGLRIGFVPTMGFLHEGHVSLVKLAKREADFVVVSIFVNPTQFNDKKDFEAYPIDIARDSKILSEVGTDALFLPTPEVIYGSGSGAARGPGNTEHDFQSWVSVEELSVPWEGAQRPGHFRGVSTVVSLLFNLFQADFAGFGEKDFQQLRLIEQMVADLKFGTAIVRGPLVREEDGVAMSSRNVRLSPDARVAARLLSQGLFRAEESCKKGQKDSSLLVAQVKEALESSPLIEPQYVAVVSEKTLHPLTSVAEPARLLVAATVGGVRLLDNIALLP
jgi:pantoate--beta-alanine ligase